MRIIMTRIQTLILLRLTKVKENKLMIIINKPIQDVFEFITNPKNTPLWTESIIEEIASSFPPQIGTIYKSRGKEGDWNSYHVTEFEPHQKFALRAADGNYTVTYRYKALGEAQTELEYEEWLEEGELEAPFEQEVLFKLKEVMEAK